MKLLRKYFDKHRQNIVTEKWNNKELKEYEALRDKYSYYPSIFYYMECLVNVEEGNLSETSEDEEISSKFSGSNLPDDYNEEADEDWENDGE